MNEGLGESLNISEPEPPNNVRPSLEQRIYSKKYTELNDLFQYSTSQSLEEKIRKYLRVGLIAKNGLENYRENLEGFDASYYLLEKGQTPTLLHKYVKNLDSTKRFSKDFKKEMLKDFEYNIREIAFKYRGLLEKKYKGRLKLNHFAALDYILKHCKMKEIKTRNDVVEVLMLAQEMGMNKIIINRWIRGKIDNKKVGRVTIAFFESYYKGNKIEVYNKIKDKISKEFGRTMSKSTFYRYIRENKESIKLIPKTDISEIQSNVG